ncbi:MAG: GAF domain-containing protein [Deltaproteobacteria bacterium]|nr:GAF domain-containing protein [Deltaproteobacteria bacterium]
MDRRSDPGLQDRLLELLDLGIRADQVSADEMRRIRILSVVTLAMMGMGVFHFVLHWRLGVYEMCAALTFTIALALANLALLRVTLRPTPAAHIAIADLTAMLIFSNYITGGFYDPNLSWLYLVPICAAVALGLRGAAFWTLATVAITVGFWALPELGIELQSRIPSELRHGQALFNRVSAIFAIGLIGSSFVASQRRAERQLARINEELFREAAYVRILQDAAISANQATSLDEAMQDSVVHICETMDWTVGHVLHVKEDGSVVSSGFIHGDFERFGRLADVSLEAHYEPGRGLPGRAAATGKPQCVHDIAASSGLGPRANVAQAAGIRSGFAVPVLVHGRVHSVLEFGDTQCLPQDDRLTEVFAHIGVELGRVAERALLHDRLRQSQKMEAVGQLAAGLAHEINNPMSYVRSNLHLVREGWESLRSKISIDSSESSAAAELREFQELIDDSLDGVERTISIVREVKEFSRFGGGGSATWATADLSELVEGAIRVASHQVPPCVRIEREYVEVPEIVGSPNQLRQVFVNLIVNAVQAIEAGGEGEGTIRLITGRDGAEAFARVEDDGPGMSVETRERLFDPFYSTKAPGEGTGLGLYVSYEIVRGHGGEIRVTSEPGCGTTFEVRLPLEIWPDEEPVSVPR